MQNDARDDIPSTMMHSSLPAHLPGLHWGITRYCSISFTVIQVCFRNVALLTHLLPTAVVTVQIMVDYIYCSILNNVKYLMKKDSSMLLFTVELVSDLQMDLIYHLALV